MPTLDANSLLADPAPIWFDDLGADSLPADAGLHDTVPGGLAADPLAAALAQVEAARQRPQLAVVPPPAADPLAMALPWLVRHLGVAAAVEAVVGPVHEDRPVPSDDVLPALRRIGFDAHLQRRSLASLGPADLPTVLLLNSGDACVLTARWQDAHGQAQCSVVLPGPQPDEFSTAEAEIDAEYSGVALLVNPPRPPFASALARARAASSGQPAATPAAAQPGQPPSADALVALAAAVQDAQRARQAGRPEAAARPAASAAVVAPPAPRQRVEPSLGAAPVAAPAARADAPRAASAQAAHRREPVLGELPAWPEGGSAEDEATRLELSFLQARRSAGPTPGQALRRIGQDTRALLRSSAGLLAGRIGQAGRALARLLAAARVQGSRRGALALLALRRCAQGLGQGAGRALRRAGFILHQCQQALLARLRQQRHRRQARLALADEALVLPALSEPAAPSVADPAQAGRWADSLAQAWQDAAVDEQAALASRPDAVVQAAFATPAPARTPTPAAVPAPALATPPARPLARPTPADTGVRDTPAMARVEPVAAQPQAAGPTVAATPAGPAAPTPVADAAAPRWTADAPATPALAQRLRRAGQAWSPLRARALAVLSPGSSASAWQACAQAARGLAGAASGHRLSWMPGLAAGSALCLLVGAPQAWAGMVSGSGLQALQVAPTLLRSAFGADLDQAARALSEQALAQLVAAKERMDCEAGQPQAGPATTPASVVVRVEEAVTAALAPQAAPSPTATRPASRNRGVPRRARHACR